ncbi:imidazoleglycerol-phosphate dehydratase HisB [Haladaptatus sp. F3-133]|jgi:imidazoleglycerol-phosphate dehydratase|uniref:Imidazoleglycerol-phosphate dehydratase n=1 Tax=Halorutilus salinus TaxID=2487751 RepID=A0A9Q4GJU9_9EURY|nr:imidazoleglycerol-phosphate dehydratase HisB [Halorutilus salinus]MCX2819576.1 imidazoleglycerol-phosphate dehydratase HisB [Halorutilus salinus]
MTRKGNAERETVETKVNVEFALDGDGKSDIETGVGFLDHMLVAVAKHGMFDLTVEADGDLETGDHHTVEDTAIVLGRAFGDAVGDGACIARFGDRRAPMDEALASVAVDVSGRGRAFTEVELDRDGVGDLTNEMVPHFFGTFARNAGVTLHVEAAGDNDHHVIEAVFKGFALALDDATRHDERRDDVPSTKGEL